MLLFKRKQPVARQSRVSGYLEQLIRHSQRQIADQLNLKTQYWNQTSKLVMLLLICLLFGGASLWLFIRAIY